MHRDKETEDAIELAQMFSKFVNSIGNHVGDVVQVLSRDHRTLQQGVTRFCVAWLEECNRKRQERDYDLRNEASAELGKKFVEKIPPENRALPFI